MGNGYLFVQPRTITSAVMQIVPVMPMMKRLALSFLAWDKAL